MDRLGDITAFRERNLFIQGADPATERGWTGVPNFILKEKRLSVGAKLTYAMLLQYAREDQSCFPGQDRLAEDMGSGRRSIVRYVAELEKAQLLEVKRRGLGKPNLYTLHLKAAFWGKPKK